MLESYFVTTFFCFVIIGKVEDVWVEEIPFPEYYVRLTRG